MKFSFSLYFFFLATHLFGQTNSYSSKIVDPNGLAVPGVVVGLKGGNNYEISDENGKFNLKIPEKNFTLEIKLIGYHPKEVLVVDGKIPFPIMLFPATEELEEVVVAALGIEKERQSITSAISNIGSRELSDVPLTNVVNSLAGRVAGVQVTNGSSGIGSSSRIIIRGENSISGNNQPLFVIDGIPIHNDLITSDLFNDEANIQEVDFGNGAAEINPDDIAAISVLKGPGSAALYGNRAANGVLLITTKKGSPQNGLGISTSSSITFENPLTLPSYQNKYGSGSNGQYAYQNGKGAGLNDGGISSYGPRLDQGLLIAQFDSPSVDLNGNPVRAGDVVSRTNPDGSLTEIKPSPWMARPENVRNFFNTGITSQQHVAVSTRNEKAGLRLSYNNLRNEGILPNTDLKRDGIALRMDQQLTEKLRVDLYGNYIYSRSKNRPSLGYGYENVMYGFNWTGRNTNISALKNYWQKGQEGIQHFDFNYLWLTNPYLTLFENTNAFNKNRLFGNISISYDISDKLSLRIRGGMDSYQDDRAFKRAFSTNRREFGGYRKDQIRFRESNRELLLTYSDQINAAWDFDFSVGGNQMDQDFDYGFTEAYQLALPGIYTLANSRTPLIGSSQIFKKKISSVYAFGNFRHLNALYLEFTYRNDWSSTLPDQNNSFGYYSAGLSYVLTNKVKLPKTISFFNLTANAASVGNDTNPYQLNNTFEFNQNYGSYFRVTNQTVLNNPNLKPERMNAIETGLEIYLFNDGLQMDFSAYQNTSINQIIGRPISSATGFTNLIENGGEVRTRGFEGMLTGKIFERSHFDWTASVNFSIYRSVVTQLPKGVEQYVTGQASVFGGSGGSNVVFYIAEEGGRVGDMFGSGFVKVDGQMLFGPNGLPVQDPTLRLLGNYNPNFILGFTQQVRFRKFSLGMVWDWRQGGTIVSRTKGMGSTSGVLKETLPGRENGIIGEGLMNIGTPEAPQYVTNTTSVSASAFYNNFYDRGNEASALYDASYIKFRQISLYYTLDHNLAKEVGFQKIQFGFIGNNLLLFTENPHFDPELNAIQGRNFTYGVEDMSYPSSRSYGFSIKTEF
ncbi:MAG: SusC/RagA family TonB-linked outer membrane protein [Cyclobacteriaceae bacterium]